MLEAAKDELSHLLVDIQVERKLDDAAHIELYRSAQDRAPQTGSHSC